MASKWLQEFDDYPYSRTHIDMDDAIIKALGWHVEELPEPEVLIVEPGTPGWPEGGKIVSHLHIVDENGDAVSSAWSSEANCWEHCEQPLFSRDLRVALMLVEGLHLNLTVFPDGSVGAEIHEDRMRYSNTYSTAGTPAMAICKAWLLWHKHTQSPE
jgi:hypothetical protein